MDFDASQQEKHRMMTGGRVSRLITRLSFPTITSMLIMALYSLADTFFVSRIGTSASGAVGIVFSLMAIIQAIGFMLGVGAGSSMSRMLGRKEVDRAVRAASTAFFTALICGAVLTVFGLLFTDPLVRMLGSTDTILPYARDYARYILIGAPYMAGSFVLNNILRSQGSAMNAMTGIAAGTILNIALDPLFIFTFGMGIAGAALATILSQLISFIILCYQCSGRGGNIRVSPKSFTPEWALFREILATGLPSFYRQGLASVAAVLLNVYSAPFGDGAIAAMSIVTRVMMFILSSLIGFGQAFQPVCGYNYGAKIYGRVLEAFWFSLRTAVIFLAVMGTAGIIFAPTILSLFRKEDAEVMAIGVRALRFQCAVLPLQGVCIITNMLFQAIGRNAKAAFLALSRQGLFFIPVILTLPHFFGILGVQMSQPAADLLNFGFAIPLLVSILKELYALKKAPPESTTPRDVSGEGSFPASL